MKIISTTLDDKEKAKDIADNLVKKKLCACVNIISNVNSVFQWKGNIETEKELLILCKTNEEKIGKCVDKIKKLHPYEEPIVEITNVKINKEAEKWLEESL